MKKLLKNAQAAIRERLAYVRDSDVFITSHENFIPFGTEFPAVGITDGDIENEDLVGGGQDRTMKVKFIPYIQRYDEEEESVMGKGPAKGILDMSEDLNGILRDNFLDIPGMQDVSCSSEKGSESYGKPGDGITRKILIYKYELREE